MNRYQRCLSRSLIFFISLVIIFILIIENNSGFQLIFRITNYFFWGVKTEKISGNWRDFTLHNIAIDLVNLSIKAQSVRCSIHSEDILNFFHITKEIDVKKVIFTMKKNQDITINTEKKNRYIQKNLFFLHDFLIDKINIDTMQIKMKSHNIFFFDISSKIKFDANKIVFFPTCINKIDIFFSTDNLLMSTKKIKKSIFLDARLAQSITRFSSSSIPSFFVFKIDIDVLTCNNLNFFYKNKEVNIHDIMLIASLKKNIVTIKKIHADLDLFIIDSYGTVIIYDNSSFSYAMHNKLCIPYGNHKILKVFIRGTIDEKYYFDIHINYFFKIHVRGIVLSNTFNNAFYIICDSSDLHLPIYKKRSWNIDVFHFILKGNYDNYFFFIQNIFHMNMDSSIYSEIHGHSNIKNILIDKMTLFQMKKDRFHQKSHVAPLRKLAKNEFFRKNHNFYTSKWLGYIDMLGSHNRNSYNFFMPNINVTGRIMEKKISILGSLYYKNYNFFQTSGMNFFLGKNKIFLKGSLGKQYNIHSFVHAHHLGYFLPHLKGSISGKLHFSSLLHSSIMDVEASGKNLRWNDVYLKSIKILTNMRPNNPLVHYIYTDIQHFSCSLFKINSLYITSELESNQKQKIHFVLKNKNLCLNILFHSFIDTKTGQWHGIFKKIHIRSVLGNWLFLKNPIFCYFFKKNTDVSDLAAIKKNILDDSLSLINYKILNLYNTKLFNIKYQLSFNAKIKWVLGRILYHGHWSLTSKDFSFDKNIQRKNFYNNVESFTISSTFENDRISMNWFLEYVNDRLKKSLLSGSIHINKIGNRQKIAGYCYFFRLPCSIIQYFMKNYPDVKAGTVVGKLTLGGDIWHPQVFSDINVYNAVIKSNNLFEYISFCVSSFFKPIKYIKTNQLIWIKKGHIFFVWNVKNRIVEWNIFLHSNAMSMSLVPYISFQLSPNIQLHYFLSKYDLIGNIQILLFVLKINEKNIIF